MRGLWTIGLVALGAAACGGGGDAGAPSVTRDSAGITIVENGAPTWAAGQEWTVTDSVLVDVSGDIDSIVGPALLSGGRIALGVAGSREIRIYDAAGNLLSKVGREGSGPGEFQNLGGLWVGPGDSLLVSDLLVRRLSVIDPAGAYQRSFSLGGASGAPMPVGGKVDFAVPQGWLGDGSISGIVFTFAINSTRQGKYRDTIVAARYGPDGTARDTIARFPGIEMIQLPMNVGGQSFSAPSAVPLGRVTITAASGDRFYLAQNDTWEVEVRQADGKLLRLIRIPRQGMALTPELVATHRKMLLEALESNRFLRQMPEPVKSQMMTQMKNGVEQAVYPETLPFIEALLIDPAGNIWVREVQPPGVETGVFTVLNPDGTLLGKVTTPARFSGAAVGNDAIYGVWRDEDDVQHLRAYRLRKGG